MSSGKKTKLFWCGIFVTVLGAYLMIARVSGVISTYQSYQNYLNAFTSHGSPIPANSGVYLTAAIIWAIIFGVVYSVLIGVGVYVAKLGLKAPEQQTTATDPTESAITK
jgi:hypothetical protein